MTHQFLIDCAGLTPQQQKIVAEIVDEIAAGIGRVARRHPNNWHEVFRMVQFALAKSMLGDQEARRQAGKITGIHL